MAERKMIEIAPSHISWDKITKVSVDEFAETIKKGGSWAEVLYGGQEYRIHLDWDNKDVTQNVEPDYKKLTEIVNERFPEAGGWANIGCAVKKTRPNPKKEGCYIQSVRFFIRKLKAKYDDMKTILEERGFTKDEGWDLGIYGSSRRMLNCVLQYKVDDPSQTPLLIMSRYDDWSMKPVVEWMNANVLYGVEKCIEPKNKVARVVKPVIQYEKSTELDNDIIHLFHLLSPSRVCERSEWIKVCGLIYSLFEEKGLSLFIELSKKCPEKFDEDVCIKTYQSMNRKNMSIGTLHYWAKQDNPEEYAKIVNDSLNKLVDIAINSEGTHYDVAQVYAKTYHDCCYYVETQKTFFFCDENTNIWKKSDGCFFNTQLPVRVQKLFYLRASYWNNLAANADNDAAKEVYAEKGKKANAIASKLKTSGYCDSVVKMLKGILCNNEFYDLLDAKDYLFAFNNCVADFKEKQIRPITPNDYILTTTGYALPLEYIDFQQVETQWTDFLKTLYREDEVREYITNVLSNSLDGRIPCNDHNIYTHTGCGRNGKSAMWVSIASKLFGEYYYKASIALICDKRKNADAPNEALMSLKGKRLIVMTEPNSEFNERVNSGFAKELSGGEVISARGLYGKQGKIAPTFYMHILCNDSLNVDGTDTALGMRLKVIQYQNKFIPNVEKNEDAGIYPQDPEYIEMMMSQTPMIMRYLIERMFKKTDKTIVPQTVKTWSQVYTDGRNPVLKFKNECLEQCTVSKPLKRAECITLAEIKQAFKNWAMNNNDEVAKKMGAEKIQTEIVKLLGSYEEQKKVEGKNVRYAFVGWHFKFEDEDDMLD